MKTGLQHIATLRDERAVYIGGERVDDVTRHSAFARTVASVGDLFDFAASPDNAALMTFETPEGGRANRIWELPAAGEL